MEKLLFHHLALPQQLPHAEDADLSAIEASLTDQLLVAVSLMRDSARDALQSGSCCVWERVRQCLAVSKAILNDGRVDRIRLLSALRTIQPLEVLLLHVRNQNAALLIHRVPE